MKPERCRKCGAEEWYQRGKYRRCTPCHNTSQLAAYHNRKVGIEQGRRSQHKARPLAEQLKFSQKKEQTACHRGHLFDEQNTRIEVDNKGRFHRRCRKCELLRYRRRYGIETKSQAKELLDQTQRPWERLNEGL